MTSGMNETQEKTVIVLGFILSFVIPFVVTYLFFYDINYALALGIMGLILYITLPIAMIPYLGWAVYIFINYLFIVPQLFIYLNLSWHQPEIIMFGIYSAIAVAYTFYIVTGKTRYEGFV